MSTQQTPQKTLRELIHGIRFGMLTHASSDGRLVSQPLTTMNKDFDRDSALYFFISASGKLAAELSAGPTRDATPVNVAYADPSDDRYVSVAGTAGLVNDPGLKEALWSVMAKAWFPGGPSDPDLALLEVKMLDADYWDVDSSKMVQLFKMAKAAATGTRPTDMGEHKHVQVS